MNLDVLNSDGKKVSSMELRDELFGGDVNEALFYEVVKMQLASRRAGAACTKTRAEVSGSGAKPWRQKGTGRARVGSKRTPVWRHGGTVFGPRPRDYSYRVPKKVVRAALRDALRLRIREGRLRLFDSLEIGEPKTRKALELLKRSNLERALIVVDGDAPNLRLAVRNLRDFKLIDVAGINTYDVLRFSDLVLTKGAMEKIEAMLEK